MKSRWYAARPASLVFIALLLFAFFIFPTTTAGFDATLDASRNSTFASSDVAISDSNEASQDGTVIVLNYLRYHIAIPGDGLIRLLRRFGISMEPVFETNPNLAARTDPERYHWLYLGETLTIPLYETQVKDRNEVSDASIIAIPMGVIRRKDDKLAKAQKELEALSQNLAQSGLSEKRAIAEMGGKNLVLTNKIDVLEKDFSALNSVADERRNWLLAALAAVLILAGIVVIPMIVRSQGSKAGTRKVKMMRAIEIVRIFRTVKGNDLMKIFGAPIVQDEHGNQITIKEIENFMRRRKDLNLGDLPVLKWEARINARKARGAQRVAPAT